MCYLRNFKDLLLACICKKSSQHNETISYFITDCCIGGPWMGGSSKFAVASLQCGK